MSEPATSWIETEALIAAIKRDVEEVASLLDQLTVDERLTLRSALQTLTEEIDLSFVRRGEVPIR